MAQSGGSNPPLMAPLARSSSSGSTHEVPGVNPELLRSMMDCVDTSLFSAAQLANWSQMKARLTAAAEHNNPVSLTGGDLAMVKKELARTPNLSEAAVAGHSGNGNVDFRQPLHREASIQDVLACLLDQEPPSARMINSQSSGGSFLVNSENMKPSGVDHKPSLKKLLSSNNFSMTEKKESLRHLLSFIDNSFASNTPEPLTQVYKDCEAGTLQRLSSLQLMRSFMPPTAHNGTQNNNGQGGMGMRTTSFEIIQAMLNATSNQAIQKPMTSQDSFRFQHLARTLESIETDVSAIDNDDYGGDDVVQVDNLDNLLDYHGSNNTAGNPSSSLNGASSSNVPSSTQGHSAGFVDTQTLLNPSRSIYMEMTSTAPSFSTFGQSLDTLSHLGYNSTSSSGSLPAMGMMNHQQNTTYHHQQQQHLQQQLQRQEQQQKQQQQYHQLYQNALLQQQQNGVMASAPGYVGTNQPMPQFPNILIQPGAGLLLQKQQQIRGGHPQQQMRISTQSGKPIKMDANGIQLCSALGCSHAARVKGMCKLHGGGRRCKVDGCMKSAQTGHLCIAHGGGKPCNVEGCPKTAQSRGLCKQHGGGVRCKFEGCAKSCQSGGFCRGHGGGKRCEYPNCTKWAQKNGHCAKHAQEIAAQQLQQQQALQAQMRQQLVHP